MVFIPQQRNRGGAKLAQVERTNIRRHAHRDTQCIVGQNAGEGHRQQGRLLGRRVIVIYKIHRVLVDFGKQFAADIFQLGLRITRSGISHIARIRLAKVAFAGHVRQQQAFIAARQPHQRIINGPVAMRVQVHCAAHNVGRFCAIAF